MRKMRKLFYLCAYDMPISPAIREKRRQAILDLVATRTITRQSELVQLLLANGFDATQSSVSRDLRELGITKLASGYGRIGVTGSPDMEVPEGYVRKVATAGNNLTVVKTATGAAQRVALYLDRSEWPEIVGTISGDDTIFVATRNAGEQKQLLSRLRLLQH
jgi:transcriptional regulator of arginine metabolism